MDTLMQYPGQVIAIGAGATAVMDLWTAVRKRTLGTPLPDYGLVGRWLAHMVLGKFRHERIASAPSIAGERQIGWIAHYAIGIAFASALAVVWGYEWIRNPTLVPALAVGIGSVAAPFFLMQPGMGAGIAASRTPKPWTARLQSLVTHAVFGLGLYATASAATTFSH